MLISIALVRMTMLRGMLGGMQQSVFVCSRMLLWFLTSSANLLDIMHLIRLRGRRRMGVMALVVNWNLIITTAFLQSSMWCLVFLGARIVGALLLNVTTSLTLALSSRRRLRLFGSRVRRL